MGVRNTRSGRMIESVQFQGLPKTRTDTNAPDTLMYLVNYANNSGFALLGADSRIAPVYAISDEGHFEYSDTASNPGLKLFLEALEDELACGDFFLPENGDPYVGAIILDSDYSFRKQSYTVYEPLLNANLRRIHQGAPINNEIPMVNNQHAPVGCVPLALALLLSYHQYPNNLYWMKPIDWESISENCECETMQELAYILGWSEFCDVTYWLDRAEANSNACLSSIKSLGYKNLPSILPPFDVDSVFYDLATVPGHHKRGPIITFGYRESYNEKNETTKPLGHAWVIDGGLKYKVRPNVYVPGDVKDLHLFHCVWGWGGTHNGFFHFRSQSGFDTTPSNFDKDDPRTQINSLTPYKIDLKMIGGVTPPSWYEN